MENLFNVLHLLFPVLGIGLLIYGLAQSKRDLILLALWVSIIGVATHYQISHGQILGIYFGYYHAILYSLNLLVLLFSSIYVLFNYRTPRRLSKIILSLFAAVTVTGVSVLLINVWVNAYFVEKRYPGSPLLQIAVFKKLPYCAYTYVFYKLNSHKEVEYLCPNFYGFIPKIGTLHTLPTYLAPHFSKYQNKT